MGNQSIVSLQLRLCTAAAAGSQLTVLQWLPHVEVQRNRSRTMRSPPRRRLTESVCAAAAARGRLHILQWLDDEERYPPAWMQAELAAAGRGGHFYVLKWLKQLQDDPSCAHHDPRHIHSRKRLGPSRLTTSVLIWCLAASRHAALSKGRCDRFADATCT